MPSPNFRTDIYDPKTLPAIDQAFAAIWHVLRADDPLHCEGEGATRSKHCHICG